jgi:hypothetical protein
MIPGDRGGRGMGVLTGKLLRISIGKVDGWLILPPSPSMIFPATKAAEINDNGDNQNQ